MHGDVNSCSHFCNQFIMLILPEVKGVFKEQAKQSKRANKQSYDNIVTNPSELAGESSALEDISKNEIEVYPWKIEVVLLEETRKGCWSGRKQTDISLRIQVSSLFS